MAALEELQKKFHDHRRWAADLLLQKEEEIRVLTAQLEQVKKKPLSHRQEQGTAQPVPAGNTVSITKIRSGLGADGGARFSSKEADSADESVLPATVPYTEYADMVQKLNLYRRNIQEKDQTLKRLIEKYQNCKAVALAWKRYAARTYEKSRKRLAAEKDVSSEILPFSPIPSPATALEMGFIPGDTESDTSSIAGILPFESSAPESRFGPKANRNRPPQTSTTIGVTTQAGENHPLTADELQVAVNSFEDDQEERLGVVRVKEEPTDSLDALQPSPGKLHRIETMDLNNIENTAATPHRNRRREAFLRRQQTESRLVRLQHVRSNSEPFEEQPFLESTMESANNLLPHRNLLPTLRRADSDPIIKVEDETYDEFLSARRSKQNAETSNESRVFHLLNPNRLVLPRTDDVSNRKKRRRASDSRSANMIHSVAEDNDVSKKKRKSERRSTGHVTDFNSRLTSLLHQPSPAKHHLSLNRPLSIVTGGVGNRTGVDFHTGDKNSLELCKHVRVGNILQTTHEDELKTFFEEFRVKSVSFASNATCYPLTFALIELSSSFEADRAIAKLNGQTFLGRKVSVGPATPTDCNPDTLNSPSTTTTVTKHIPEVAPLQSDREPSMARVECDNQSRKVVTQKKKSNPNPATSSPTKPAKNANCTTTDTDKQTISKESTDTVSTLKQPPRPTYRLSGQPPWQPFPTIPLRKRPVSELQLSDFKLNPRTNQGYDYAFVETAGSRENRHQLHRCTDPNCCGPVMRAIASESTSTTSRALTEVSQTDRTPYSISDEDAQFLHEYLGEAFNLEIIYNMSAAQRDNLVFAARTKVAADRNGKQRCRNERHNTPPGFWRTDMPTTQELEHDREEARRLERRKVEERWKEALKEGGLWLFRDES